MHGEVTTVVVGKRCAFNKNVLPQKEGPVAFDSLYIWILQTTQTQLIPSTTPFPHAA